MPTLVLERVRAPSLPKALVGVVFPAWSTLLLGGAARSGPQDDGTASENIGQPVADLRLSWRRGVCGLRDRGHAFACAAAAWSPRRSQRSVDLYFVRVTQRVARSSRSRPVRWSVHVDEVELVKVSAGSSLASPNPGWQVVLQAAGGDRNGLVCMSAWGAKRRAHRVARILGNVPVRDSVWWGRRRAHCPGLRVTRSSQGGNLLPLIAHASR